MIRKYAIAAGASLVVTFAVACGGGDDGGSNGGAADDTTGQITNDQLSRMVLTLPDLGPDFAGFAADQKNGVQDLQTASEQDFDPTGERADLESAGFAGGYRNLYQRQASTGTFFAGSGVYVFGTKEGAGKYVSDSRDELKEYLGKTIGDLTIKSSSPFDVTVADEAVGGNQDIDIKSSDGSTVTVWYTAVLFRRGRLTGVTAISAIGPSESEKQRLQGRVGVLAGSLNDRVGSVLAGSSPAALAP